MRKFFKEYFTFNRRERNGILILCAILLLLVLFNFSIPFLFNNDVPRQDATFKSEVETFLARQKQYEDSVSKSRSAKSFNYKSYKRETPASYFYFNPNNLPEEKWKQLGLKDWQIKVIKNYERKGGKFYSKEDVKKIYGISPKLYASLEPYILIPASPKEEIKKEKAVKAPAVIELNTADSAILTTLKGIGPAFASRIIKYRDRLGGFTSKEQLKEVYGINEETYTLVAGNVTADASAIKKISINTASAEELKNHPYLNRNISNSIVNIRKMHGSYRNIEEIRRSDLVNDELYRKIAPYITVE